MNKDDYRRLYAKAQAKWRASIPGLPLNKLEMRALTQLAQYGPGNPHRSQSAAIGSFGCWFCDL